MYIEHGVVDGVRIALGYGTAAAAFAGTVKLVVDFAREKGFGALVAKSVLAAMSVFVFFELFFHYPVGVSEVHLVLGTSLLLLFGAAPAAIGLAIGFAGSGGVLRAQRLASVRNECHHIARTPRCHSPAGQENHHSRTGLC
jgi:hypothetical protein